MIAYLNQCYFNREFCLALVGSDIRKRYRRSALGVSWAILQPCALAAVITVVLHRAFNDMPQDYFLYVLIGLCFWNFIGYVINSGCQCITSARPYILERRIPLAIYPLRQTLVAGFEILMAMIPAVLLALFTVGIPSPAAVITLLWTLINLMILGWSLACLFGVFTVYVADVPNIMRVVLQIAFYATPIIWRRESVRLGSSAWLVNYNPLAAFVDLIRAPLMTGSVSEDFVKHALLVLTMTTTVTLFTLFLLFKVERKVVKHL